MLCCRALVYSVISACLLALLVSNLRVNAADKTVPAFVLEQESRIVGKHLSLYVTANAVRWSNRVSALNVVSVAPKWNVAVFSTRTRRIFRCSLAEYQGPYGSKRAYFSRFSLQAVPFRFRGVETLHNLPVTHYGYVAARHDQVPQIVHYWCFRDPSIKEQAYTILNKTYTMNSDRISPGVPVKFTYKYRLHAGLRTNLKTIVLKRDRVSQSVFEVPTGLSAVKTPEEVTRDPEAEGFLDSLLR